MNNYKASTCSTTTEAVFFFLCLIKAHTTSLVTSDSFFSVGHWVNGCLPLGRHASQRGKNVRNILVFNPTLSQIISWAGRFWILLPPLNYVGFYFWFRHSLLLPQIPALPIPEFSISSLCWFFSLRATTFLSLSRIAKKNPTWTNGKIQAKGIQAFW